MSPVYPCCKVVWRGWIGNATSRLPTRPRFPYGLNEAIAGAPGRGGVPRKHVPGGGRRNRAYGREDLLGRDWAIHSDLGSSRYSNLATTIRPALNCQHGEEKMAMNDQLIDKFFQGLQQSEIKTADGCLHAAGLPTYTELRTALAAVERVAARSDEEILQLFHAAERAVSSKTVTVRSFQIALTRKLLKLAAAAPIAAPDDKEHTK